MTDTDRGPFAATNWVPAFDQPVIDLPAPRVSDGSGTPAWLTERQAMELEQAFRSLPGTHETTSAMDRAQALRVRLLPFALSWALLSVIVGVGVFMLAKNTPGAGMVALLTFSGMTAFSYYRLNRTDYDYSREGTERYKVSEAASLMRERMYHEHELREMALRAYLKHLERTDDRR